MASVSQTLKDLVENIIAFLVMFILAIVGFYLTVFVVSTGAAIAGLNPGADFVILSAALLVVAAILGGGNTPIGYVSGANRLEREDEQSYA